MLVKTNIIKGKIELFIGKASACNVGDTGPIPGSGKISWSRKQQPTPVFMPGESHGQRSLVGHSPRGRKESDIVVRACTFPIILCLLIFYW